MTHAAVEKLVAEIVGLKRPLLLAFDVDGTLSPIVNDPADASVPNRVQQDLQALSEAEGVHVALVTGRDLRSLKAMVDVEGAHLAVEHGARVLSPGEDAQQSTLSEQEQQRLEQFAQWAQRHALPLGATLEAKRASRVVHVRTLAAQDHAAADALLAQAAQEAEKLGLHPRPGRAVLEAALVQSDKAIALAELASKTRAAGIMFAGDDLTDLNAIQKSLEMGGLGVFVRSSERPSCPFDVTAALDGPSEVQELVAKLARALT